MKRKLNKTLRRINKYWQILRSFFDPSYDYPLVFGDDEGWDTPKIIDNLPIGEKI